METQETIRRAMLVCLLSTTLMACSHGKCCPPSESREDDSDPAREWPTVAVLSTMDMLTATHVGNLLESAGLVMSASGGVTLDIRVPPTQEQAARMLLREDSKRIGYPLQPGEDGYVNWLSEYGKWPHFPVGVDRHDLHALASSQNRPVLAAVGRALLPEEAALLAFPVVVNSAGVVSRPFLNNQHQWDTGYHVRLDITDRTRKRMHTYFVAWKEGSGWVVHFAWYETL